MSDFNFFEPFIEPPAKQSSMRLIFLIVLGALAIGITYIQINYFTEKALLEASIDEQLAYLNSSEVVNKTTALNEKETAYSALKIVSEELNFFEILIQLKGKLHVGLLETIHQKVPEYVFVNTMNVTATEMIISGYADSYESVALFQHQLRQVDQFRQVFVPSVVEEQGNYLFTITASFKQEVKYANQ